MYDFKLTHVGKDLFRSESKEEDIIIKNEISGGEFPVSLKAYGDGPLQLSTDKNFKMYPFLEKYGNKIHGTRQIEEIFSSGAFSYFSEINILPLIYDEKKQQCNILVFASGKARKSTSYIKKESLGRGRKHPVKKGEQY